MSSLKVQAIKPVFIPTGSAALVAELINEAVYKNTSEREFHAEFSIILGLPEKDDGNL